MQSEHNVGELPPVPASGSMTMSPGRAQQVTWLLAASVALLMTGYGLVIPVFARHLEEIGAGVAELSYMTMAFALGQVLFAPYIGSLADRYGRRPPILVALGGLVLGNIAFLVTDNIPIYIISRFLQGAITAGLLPAAMGVVSDIMPESQRARWVGIVMGGYGVGFIFGPTLGGLLFDGWGYAMPFIVSAILGLLSLVFALILIPETLRPEARSRHPTREERGDLLASLPRPLYLLGTMLLLDFTNIFAFAYIEPQMIFYLYNALGFSATQFGLIIGAYGLAMVIGQGLFGSVSDYWGRKLPIFIGFVINVPFYLGLLWSSSFAVLFIVALVAGFGAALLTPALSALYLDISSEAHRSRVMGLKESSAALGGVIGPLSVAFASSTATPSGIFLSAAVFTGIAAMLAIIVLPSRKHSA